MDLIKEFNFYFTANINDVGEMEDYIKNNFDKEEHLETMLCFMYHLNELNENNTFKDICSKFKSVLLK